MYSCGNASSSAFIIQYMTLLSYIDYYIYVNFIFLVGAYTPQPTGICEMLELEVSSLSTHWSFNFDKYSLAEVEVYVLASLVITQPAVALPQVLSYVPCSHVSSRTLC